MTTGDGLAGVPSDSWTQLLVYRKDLFEARPAWSLPDDVRVDPGRRGGAQHRGPGGNRPGHGERPTPSSSRPSSIRRRQRLRRHRRPRATSPSARRSASKSSTSTRTWCNNGSVTGAQDADTTRAAYFAGEAAMIVWSSFILDELAGLRDDALPTCPECADDPLPSWRRTAAWSRPSRDRVAESHRSSASMVSFVISADAPVDEAQQFVEFMMSDAYVDWLAIAPEGKFPTRLGTAENPTEYAGRVGRLAGGRRPKMPLGEVYDAGTIEALTRSSETMKRWAFSQGQGPLAGAPSSSRRRCRTRCCWRSTARCRRRRRPRRPRLRSRRSSAPWSRRRPIEMGGRGLQ